VTQNDESPAMPGFFVDGGAPYFRRSAVASSSAMQTALLSCGTALLLQTWRTPAARSADTGRAALQRLTRGTDQRPARRRHVVQQHDRSTAHVQVRESELHLGVAESHLAADRMLQLGGTRGLRHPLTRLLIGTHQHRTRHLHGDETPQQRRRRQRNTPPLGHDLVQTRNPVQVRIHRHHPVKLRRQQRGNVPLADSLSRRKFHVLPHVGQIRRHQYQVPHPPAPRSGRGDQQFDQAVVRLMLQTPQHNDVSRHRLGQDQAEFPIRKTVARDHAQRTAELTRQTRGQLLFIFETKQHRQILAPIRTRRASGIPGLGAMSAAVGETAQLQSLARLDARS
jgi:hypothetical protein